MTFSDRVVDMFGVVTELSSIFDCTGSWLLSMSTPGGSLGSWRMSDATWQRITAWTGACAPAGSDFAACGNGRSWSRWCSWPPACP
jgi:hypothetical protein